MPERSGLPFGALGVRALRLGLPSAVRGIPGVRVFNHCPAAGIAPNNTTAVARTTAPCLMAGNYSDERRAISSACSESQGRLQAAQRGLSCRSRWSERVNYTGPMALATGTRLGPYEVTSQLGAGGMGEVYRAHHTALKRDVAIKIVPAA